MNRFRRPAVLAAAAAALLVLSACGGGSSETSAPAAGTDAAFPVTLKHVHGETRITEKPQRIATIGWMTHDIVAALGTAPVLVPETWGGDAEGFTPWFRDQVTNELGAEMPEVLGFDGEDPDFEQVLASAPDLILAPHSGVTETQYQRLSEIAPTVAYAEKPWLSGGWKELTEVISTAMGEQQKGQELIASTQSAIQTAAAEHPNLKGASFIYTLSLKEGNTEAGFYVSGDPRVAFLRELGMVDSPTLAEALGDMDPDQFNGAVSLEKLNEVDADVVVAWSSTDADTEFTVQHPTFSRWEPISEGQYYFVANTTLGMATSGPDPLSIPWAIEKGYVADISAAIDGGKVTVPEAG